MSRTQIHIRNMASCQCQHDVASQITFRLVQGPIWDSSTFLFSYNVDGSFSMFYKTALIV